MNYQTWVDLFGKAADDPQVRDAAAKAKITKPLKIAKGDLDVRADIKGQGTTVVFTDETILRPGPGSLIGRPILSAVMLILQHPDKKNLYKGPLPPGFSISDSQSALRARLGKPAQSNDDARTDAWVRDGLTVAATYAKDLQSLNRLSLSLPGSN
jgi:hypothetical protein